MGALGQILGQVVVAVVIALLDRFFPKRPAAIVRATDSALAGKRLSPETVAAAIEEKGL